MTPTKETILTALPEFKNEWVVVRDEQDVYDIIKEIKKSHGIAASYYDRIALYFDDDDIEQICNSLYRFCKKYIHYREETEDEQSSKLPNAMLIEGHGDCKHYAGFCAGVLDALNRTGKKIDWCYRFASYKITDRNPHHVFVVVYDGENEIWIDPTPGAEKRTPLWVLDKKFSSPMALIRNIGDVNGSKDNDELPPLPYYSNGQWNVYSNDNAVGGFFDWFAQTWADIYTTGVKTLLPLATGISTGSPQTLIQGGSQVLNNLSTVFSGVTGGTPTQTIYQLFPLPTNPTAVDVKTALQGICQHLAAENPSMSSDWRNAYADILTRYGQAYAQSQGFSVDAITSNEVSPSNANLIFSYLTDPNSGVKLGTGSFGSGVMAWVKSNPILAGGIAFGAVLLIKKFVSQKKQVSGMQQNKQLFTLLIAGLLLWLLLKKKTTTSQTTTPPVTSTSNLTAGSGTTMIDSPPPDGSTTLVDQPLFGGTTITPLPPVSTDIIKEPYGTDYSVTDALVV